MSSTGKGKRKWSDADVADTRTRESDSEVYWKKSNKNKAGSSASNSLGNQWFQWSRSTGQNWQSRAGAVEPIPGNEQGEEDEDDEEDDYRVNKEGCTKMKKELAKLSPDEITNPTRRWLCPVCQGGKGGSQWYIGVQAFIQHAKNKQGKRWKLHRELANLLGEELTSRGASIVPAAEFVGQWRGLKEEDKDCLIVWPPMVLIENTSLGQKDANPQAVGISNHELLHIFKTYHPDKAIQSYGPRGHSGKSILIFEASSKGYFRALRLARHFADQGRDRHALHKDSAISVLPDGKMQLYGYMATKEDVDDFDKHSNGKAKQKYEMISYKEEE